MLNGFIGEAKGIFNVITLTELFLSLVCGVLGIVFLSNNEMNYVLVAVIVGIISMITGAVQIMSYAKRENIDLYNMNMLFGIIFLILGFVTLFMGKSIHIMAAIYLIVCGLNKIYYGILLKKFNESSWMFTLVMGILFLVIAIIMFITSAEKTVSVTGVGLFGYGVINIALNILLRNRSRFFIA